MGWEMSRDTIGQSRTWILGRAFGGLWFFFVASWVGIAGLILTAIHAVLEGIYTIVLNRPLNVGRTWPIALFEYGIQWGKYPLGAASYPGLMPSKEMGKRRAM